MKLFVMILAAGLLVSCEKNVTVKLNDAAETLVVEGEIETNQPPIVYLTKSFSFYSQLNPTLLSNAFVHNAIVTISNGSLVHTLKEYEVSLVPGISIWYYSIDSSNLSTSFVGELQKRYTLNINWNGKNYTSQTTIPALTETPDSVWFKPAPLNPDTNKRVMYIKATDPPGLGNYSRYFTKTNAEPFFPGENSVFDDQVIDGTTFTFILQKGINRNDPPKRDDNFYVSGDTVTLKFCNIDRQTFKFWNTWEFAFQSIGNPFSQPNKVLGNISNGALGAFCGYASWYGTYFVR